MGLIMRGRKCYTGRVKFTDYQNIGKIDAFMRTTAPDGYLACDGSTYNIADYPLLCDVFASDFGSVNYFGGDGTTTFAVPDLRGEFLRGTGTGGVSGISGGSVGAHQEPTKHYDNYNPDAQGGWVIQIANGQEENTDKFYGNYTLVGVTGNGRTASTGVKYASRPTNTSVLYCIRAY